MRIRGLAVLAALALVSSWPAARADDSPALGDVGGALDQARARAPLTPAPAAAAQLPDDPWKRVRHPTTTPPEAIGGYSAGCLRGGKAIELTGRGFQVMRLSRRRYFGHPALLDYIRAFASSERAAGLGSLLIGDMAQPRGGPTLSGHASHQTGLDVDIWFLQTASGKVLTPEEREKLSSPSLVIGDFDSLSPHWNPAEMDVLKIAASDPKVERIFVNPMIKKEICAHHAGEAWLGRLRPWWGHNDHFHVRLVCPAGEAHCKAQGSPPAGDGCGADLAEWFTPEKREEAKRMKEHPTPPTMPTLPPLCAQVLTE
ncbi:MAG: penicillin-insensitive murein endopeptidase [Elusimicrobia bacterium]|nr:penicillin-insensitive murein endopeptidase [Elusimicrobiota bacterium]